MSILCIHANFPGSGKAGTRAGSYALDKPYHTLNNLQNRIRHTPQEIAQ